MLVSPRENGLTSLFKEVRVFKGGATGTLPPGPTPSGTDAAESLRRRGSAGLAPEG